MILSLEEQKLFYKLFHPLQLYTNARLNVFKNVNRIEDLSDLESEQQVTLRDHLFDN